MFFENKLTCICLRSYLPLSLSCAVTHTHTHAQMCVRKHAGNFGGSVPCFGTLFLSWNCIGRTKNLCVENWTVTEILTWEKVVFLWFRVLYLFSIMCCLYSVQVCPWAKAKLCGVCAVWSSWNPKNGFYETYSSFSEIVCLWSHSDTK
jgi:hypothetical protein